MIRPDRSTYTPIDFKGWHEAGTLVLSPKFQRRGVWTTPARSYLIDTILLGMPIPPIYLRIVQSPERDRVIREVVDGQQRISAILDFLAGKYSLSSKIESVAAGKKFKGLTENQKDQIRQYPFICEVFQGVEDTDVLQIFARLNTHAVKLNAQELRNGRFFGLFKRLAYKIAFEHLEFWRNNRIFTEMGIARMSEVELTSELMILQIAGMQDKKKSIDSFYEKFDDKFPNRSRILKSLRTTIDTITDICGDVLSQSEFRRPPLFYTLYGVVYHRLFGFPGCRLRTPKKGRLTSTEKNGIDSAIRKLSELILMAKNDEEISKAYDRFVNAAIRQTDNIRPRTTRLEFLYKEAFNK